MCASPSPSFAPIKAPETVQKGAPLLDPAGAKVIIGWSPDVLAAPIAPGPAVLFGPRGACLHPNGSLWVTDTGHHRVLGWNTVPTSDNAPADILLGQLDFGSEGRNAKRDADVSTMNVPTGIAAWGEGLAVADAWNHRVLLWRTLPTSDNQAPDIVLGQDDGGSVEANRGRDAPDAASLHWPYGVAEVNGALVVADTGNRRVLIWHNPERTGQSADLVLGQKDFNTRDENGGHDVDASSMRWPHGIANWQGGLSVSDAGNNRIMLWDDVPDENGAPADHILGQDTVSACDHNKGAYYPDAGALNMPYGIAVADHRLVIADTANSRMLGWSANAASADRLSGQPDFASKGDNGWGVPGRDTLCWPYGVSLAGNVVAIADSGNNRVLIWDLMP